MQGKSPEAFLQSPYLRGGPERAGSLCVFSASFFFTFSTTCTALLTLKSVSHGPDLYTVVSTSPGIQGHQGWHRVSISLCLLGLTSLHPYHLQSLPPFSPLSALGLCL